MEEMFKEFPDTTFFLYHTHNNIKIPIQSDNVEIVVTTSKESKQV